MDLAFQFFIIIVHQDEESRRKEKDVEEENGHIIGEAIVEPYLITKNALFFVNSKTTKIDTYFWRIGLDRWEIGWRQLGRKGIWAKGQRLLLPKNLIGKPIPTCWFDKTFLKKKNELSTEIPTIHHHAKATKTCSVQEKTKDKYWADVKKVNNFSQDLKGWAIMTTTTLKGCVRRFPRNN